LSRRSLDEDGIRPIKRRQQKHDKSYLYPQIIFFRVRSLSAEALAKEDVFRGKKNKTNLPLGHRVDLSLPTGEAPSVRGEDGQITKRTQTLLSRLWPLDSGLLCKTNPISLVFNQKTRITKKTNPIRTQIEPKNVGEASLLRYHSPRPEGTSSFWLLQKQNEPKLNGPVAS
jgi:hypothetical protein